MKYGSNFSYYLRDYLSVSFICVDADKLNRKTSRSTHTYHKNDGQQELRSHIFIITFCSNKKNLFIAFFDLIFTSCSLNKFFGIFLKITLYGNKTVLCLDNMTLKL